MKIDYWLELPTALIDLLGEHSDENERELSKHLITTNMQMKSLIKKIEDEITFFLKKASYSKEEEKIISEINKLQLRIENIQKERTNILIQAVKFSISLLNKLVASAEAEVKSKQSILDYRFFTKIKLAISIVRNIYCQTMSNISASIKRVNEDDSINNKRSCFSNPKTENSEAVQRKINENETTDKIYENIASLKALNNSKQNEFIGKKGSSESASVGGLSNANTATTIKLSGQVIDRGYKGSEGERVSLDGTRSESFFNEINKEKSSTKMSLTEECLKEPPNNNFILENSEFNFFYLVKIFIEKIESKFFNLSLKMISNTFKEFNENIQSNLKKKTNHRLLKPMTSNIKFANSSKFCGKSEIINDNKLRSNSKEAKLGKKITQNINNNQQSKEAFYMETGSKQRKLRMHSIDIGVRRNYFLRTRSISESKKPKANEKGTPPEDPEKWKLHSNKKVKLNIAA